MSNITSPPQKPQNVDFSKVTFSTVKSLPSGAKIIYLNYEGASLFVQTPEMTVPYDSGTYYPDNDSSGKYAVKVSMDGFQADGPMKKFHDMLQGMDQKIMESGMENSLAWFKKKSASRDIAETLFNRMIKVSTDRETGEPDGKWPPTMKLKVPRRDGTWETKVHDKAGKVYSVNDVDSGDNMEDLLVKNTKMRAIIQCVGLWVASGNYMCQWKLVKAEVDVPETFCSDDFLAESDDEDNVDHEFVEDSGDDAEADGDADADGAEAVEPASPEPSPEPAPEPETPKKKVVKRVVRRKKTSN